MKKIFETVVEEIQNVTIEVTGKTKLGTMVEYKTTIDTDLSGTDFADCPNAPVVCIHYFAKGEEIENIVAGICRRLFADSEKAIEDGRFFK